MEKFIAGMLSAGVLVVVLLCGLTIGAAVATLHGAEYVVVDCPTELPPENATHYCWCEKAEARSYHSTCLARGCAPIKRGGSHVPGA